MPKNWVMLILTSVFLQYGMIINIGSSAATSGFPSGSVYCASKFALRGLTECWRHELRRDNIRVVLVNPSEVPTRLFNYCWVFSWISFKFKSKKVWRIL